MGARLSGGFRLFGFTDLEPTAVLDGNEQIQRKGGEKVA
jgi:hypothetical protein